MTLVSSRARHRHVTVSPGTADAEDSNVTAVNSGAPGCALAAGSPRQSDNKEQRRDSARKQACET